MCIFLDVKGAYQTFRRNGKFVSKVDTKCMLQRVVRSSCGNDENCGFFFLEGKSLDFLVRVDREVVPCRLCCCFGWQ